MGKRLAFVVLAALFAFSVLGATVIPARAETITLKAVCGPDDYGSACITIMNPDED